MLHSVSSERTDVITAQLLPHNLHMGYICSSIGFTLLMPQTGSVLTAAGGRHVGVFAIRHSPLKV